MDNETKVQELYELYVKVDPKVEENDFTFRLVSKIVEHLTDDEYEYLLNYMSGEEYAGIYNASFVATRELMEEAMNPISNVVDFEDDFNDPNKYGKN